MNERRNGSRYLGRDHHPRAFTVWMAGGGIRTGTLVGATDELGYNAVEDPAPRSPPAHDPGHVGHEQA